MITIIDVKVYKSILDYYIHHIDEERTIANPKANEGKLLEYLSACLLAVELFGHDAQFDDPKMPYQYHCMSIDIKDTDFDGERFDKFISLLGKSSGLSFFGKKVLNVVLYFENLYS